MVSCKEIQCSFFCADNFKMNIQRHLFLFRFNYFIFIPKQIRSQTSLTSSRHLSAPENTDSFQTVTQDETSVTLQWNQVTKNSFLLTFSETNIFIPVPEGNGPINYTVSNLTAGAQYTFILFTVFENTFSSGVTTVSRTGKFGHF